LCAEEGAHLNSALGRQQAEMRVDHLHDPLAESNRYPNRPPWLDTRQPAASGKKARSHEFTRMCRQNGIAELLPEDMDRRLEVKCHPKFMGDQLGLIDLPAAEASDIKLLKAHNVGFAGSNDAHNAPG